MNIKLERLEVQSRRDVELIDITPEVERVVRDSGIRNGIVNVLTMHTSSGIIVTEGMALDGTTLEKANEEGIPILTTELTAFTVVGRLFELGVPGVD